MTTVAIDNLLSINEAADKLGITGSLVRRYCREKRIGTKVGNSWVISEDEIRLFDQILRRRGRPSTNGHTPSDKSGKSS